MYYRIFNKLRINEYKAKGDKTESLIINHFNIIQPVSVYNKY